MPPSLLYLDLQVLLAVTDRSEIPDSLDQLELMEHWELLDRKVNVESQVYLVLTEFRVSLDHLV